MIPVRARALLEDSTASALTRVGSSLLVALALNCSLLVVLAAWSQTQSATPGQTGNLIRSLEGPDLFRAYCASCHGLNGTGGGPAALALKAQVPDLRLLAENNGGQFPSARVRKMIVGDETPISHGSREMPVWGPVFHQIEADKDLGYVRIENLLTYLQLIQSIAPSRAPSGAQLYQQHCAPCHGSDLKGTGPVPYPYRVPPDLTTLARRHDGKFPAEYVSDVLRNGVVLPAHGPAEMPAWGTDFRVGGQLDAAQVRLRIAALTDYIASRQVK